MDKKLEKLKKAYKETPIPTELDELVQKAIKHHQKPKRRKSLRGKWMIGVAAAAIIFVLSINTSQTFAESLSNIPVVGSIVEVLTIKEMHVDEDNYNANIKVPKVNHLGDKDLEDSLNQKYLDENEQLYKQFKKEMKELKTKDGGHLAVDSSYEVKTDDEQIFSIERTVEEIEASSYTTHQYDTIDKQKQIMLTLPILFKDEQYIKNISEEIKDQMRKQMKEDDNKIYWVSGAGVEDLDMVDSFEQISKDQNFYINEDHKLVISFDDYEVAPGYMGDVEFVIPTERIERDLVGKKYIQ